MKKFNIVMALAVGLAATSCVDDANDTIIVEKGIPTDIPSDAMAGETPYIYGDNNATIPNIQYTTVDENGNVVIRLDMSGIQDKNTLEWLRLAGTGESGQNVWLEIDGKPKGIKVYNSSDNGEVHTVPIDLVFLVDNSGSMDDEANAIARDIVDWANALTAANLDIRFGCVGYDGRITGAINLTTASALTEYLNYSSGTSRTCHFGGSDASWLKGKAGAYSPNSSAIENGVAALRFADELYNFRASANRIYVNFTDENNEARGNHRWSVESLKTDWDSSRGTVHTVYSDYSKDSNHPGYSENPWLMSEYTGGTTIFTNGSFTGVSLSSLPVSDAMLNSYIIRFTNVDEYLDGRSHTIKIVVNDGNGNVQAVRTFNVVFSSTPVTDETSTPSTTHTTVNGGFPDEKTNFGTGNAPTAAQLVGTWAAPESDGTYLIYTFNANGTGTARSSDGGRVDYITSYKVENGRLLFLWQGYPVEEWDDKGPVYFVDSNTFILNLYDNEIMTFHRQ